MGMTEVFRELGRYNAQRLKEELPELDGTQIISREHCVAPFAPQKDYTSAPIGTPVTDEGQVWCLIQPYHAAHYAGRPSTLRAHWGLLHTTEPGNAKAWVDAYGTSGLYKAGEVYKDEAGVVWRCVVEQTSYPAHVLPGYWEVVEDG
ncbi:MAG: hypothetical protein IJ461_07310 [Clostridia bacterium]|nr:hypothetical protein [Clostridia bacterium]